MDNLKAFNGSIGEIVKKGVAIVEFGRDKCICKKFSRVHVKGGSDLAELANLIESIATNICDVLIVGEVRVKFDSEVSSMRCWRDGCVTKRNGRAGDFGALLASTNEEEFGFGWVNSETV